MAMIDLSYMQETIKDICCFCERIAKKEQTEGTNNPSEDVSSTVVTPTITDNEITFSLTTNTNNDTDEWLYNYYTIVESLIPSLIEESVTANPEPMIEQIILPSIDSLLGGVSQ